VEHEYSADVKALVMMKPAHEKGRFDTDIGMGQKGIRTLGRLPTEARDPQDEFYLSSDI